MVWGTVACWWIGFFQGNTDLKNEVQSFWPTPKRVQRFPFYSLGYAYACPGVETESFTFTRWGTKAVKWCVLMSLWHPFISPGLNTSVGSLELLRGVSLTCCFECRCDTVHRWIWTLKVYPWVLKTLRSHGFSNFQCMEAELLPVPIPSPARWPWMLFEPYNQGWKTRNRHKMSLGLGKYWACTLCMYFRKKCWVFYHPLGFWKAFLTSIQICLFGSNLRLPVASVGETKMVEKFCFVCLGMRSLLLSCLWVTTSGTPPGSGRVAKSEFVTRGQKHLKLWRN